MFSTEFKCTGNDRNIASDENAIFKTNKKQKKNPAGTKIEMSKSRSHHRFFII